MYVIITRDIETCTESPTQMLVFWHIHLARPLTTQHPPLETTIAKSNKSLSAAFVQHSRGAVILLTTVWLQSPSQFKTRTTQTIY